MKGSEHLAEQKHQHQLYEVLRVSEAIALMGHESQALGLRDYLCLSWYEEMDRRLEQFSLFIF
jgi:hypothetical protein